MAGIDFEKLPTEELEAIRNKDWEKVSLPTLELLRKKEEGTTRSVPEKAYNFVRSSIPMAGAVVGGVVGGMAGGPAAPATAIAGAGLGGAAGAATQRFLDRKMGYRAPPTGVLDEASKVGKDFVEGTQMEMGGQAAGNLVNRAGTALAKSGAADWLYGKAVKTPGGTWDRLYKGEELTARQKLRKAGVEDEILPIEKGLAKAQSIVTDITKQVEEQVAAVTQAGKTVPRGIVDQGLAGPTARAAASGEEATNIVRGIRDANRAKSTGKGWGDFTPDQVLSIERQLTKEVNWEAKNPIFNVKGQFTQDAKRALAETMVKELETLSPQLKSLLPKSAARIDLIKAVEHTIGTEATKDPIGFYSKMAASLSHLGLAITHTVLRVPSIQARLSFAIAKGAEWSAKTSTKAAAATVYGVRGGDRSDIIRYDNEGNRIK